MKFLKWSRLRRRGLTPLVLVLCLAVGALTPDAHAASEDVPIPLQAALLKKVASFDRALEGKALGVILVYENETPAELSEMLTAFKKVGLPPTLIKASDFKSRPAAPIAFVLSSALLPAVLAECERAKILTISRSVDGTLAGKTTLAFAMRADSKPQIVIHLGRAKAEGRDFAAGMLSLARVIR